MEKSQMEGRSGRENEKMLLERFPDYMKVLDRERQQDFVRRRLAAVQRRNDPFPHVWVEDVLSPDLYALLDAAWPYPEQFPAEERSNRRDMVPSPAGINPADKRADTYDALPKPVREVWDF